MPKTNIPALTQFIQDSFEGRYQSSKKLVHLTSTSTKLVDNNFERLALYIINTSIYEASVSPEENTTNARKIIIAGNGGMLSLTARDDLILVGENWSGLISAGSGDIYVIELVRYLAG